MTWLGQSSLLISYQVSVYSQSFGLIVIPRYLTLGQRSIDTVMVVLLCELVCVHRGQICLKMPVDTLNICKVSLLCGHECLS